MLVFGSILLTLVATAHAQIFLGTLSTREHEVTGDVYLISNTEFRIEAFVYDGQAPAAYWWTGTGRPNNQGRRMREQIRGFNSLVETRRETVSVHMPDGLTVADVDYISVWCEAFDANFGEVFFDIDNIEEPTVEPPQPTVEPPQPTVEPPQPTVEPSETTVEPSETTVQPPQPTVQPSETTVQPSETTVESPQSTDDQPETTVESTTASPSPTTPADPQTSEDVLPDNVNCEMLNDEFRMSWEVDQGSGTITIELASFIEENFYMGFGVSGSNTETRMVGGDPAIAILGAGDAITVEDFFMSAQAQCSGGNGVCRDTDRNESDELTVISTGREGGLLKVKYSRPLSAVNVERDLSYDVSSEDALTYVVWAIGPVNEQTKNPLFHSVAYAEDDVAFAFGRPPVNNCVPLPLKDDTGNDNANNAFVRPVIVADENDPISVRIGPTGGTAFGYPAITGTPAWGISMYMNGILIPHIGVERGKTYRFLIQSGDDAENGARFHPLYITDSSTGGFAQKDPAARAEEALFAGINNIILDADGGITNYTSLTGPLCRYQETEVSDPSVNDYDAYSSSLELVCDERIGADPDAESAGGTVLEWTVADDTPDVVYYQCVTHTSLGWKIRVFDEGEVDEQELIRNMNSLPTEVDEDEDQGQDGDQNQPDANCALDTQFAGTLQFEACNFELQNDYHLYWTLDESTDTARIAFTAPVDGTGYAGFGIGEDVNNAMIGAHVAVASVQADGSVQAFEHVLTQRSRAGVEDGNLFTDLQAEMGSDGRVIVHFERTLSGEVGGTNRRRQAEERDYPAIDAAEDTLIVYAVGSEWLPGQPTQHSSRYFENFNFAEGVSSTATSEREKKIEAHVYLMLSSWGIILPLGVLSAAGLRSKDPLWFHLHRILMLVGYITMTAGFALGLDISQRTPNTENHYYIGVTIFALSTFQVLNGLLRPHKVSADAVTNGSSKKAKIRFGWEILHRLEGCLLLVLAITNIWLGLDLYEVYSDDVEILRYTMALAGWVFTGLAFILISWRLFIKPCVHGKDDDLPSNQRVKTVTNSSKDSGSSPQGSMVEVPDQSDYGRDDLSVTPANETLAASAVPAHMRDSEATEPSTRSSTDYAYVAAPYLRDRDQRNDAYFGDAHDYDAYDRPTRE